MQKIKVAILFGGKSAEHEISIRSAENVIHAIDKEKYELVLIFIDKKGRWYTNSKNLDARKINKLSTENFDLSLAFSFDGKGLMTPTLNNQELPVDVFFPILHGPYGEDGTIQGLFRIMDVPFVGCDVLGSSVAMDKQVMKRLLTEADIPIGKYLTALPDDVPAFSTVEEELGLPFYVKPANMGSSVGITKVNTQDEYEQAINLAFEYDLKIVIEENIIGKEVECAVLGNRKASASVVGEIMTTHEFYTYSSKYLDDSGFKIVIPAEIDRMHQEAIREMAVRVFKALDGSGLGRVDVFLRDTGEILVNEMNSMPGFTSISMYPMLWKETGINYPELIDKLIELGLDRHAEFQKLKTSI